MGADRTRSRPHGDKLPMSLSSVNAASCRSGDAPLFPSPLACFVWRSEATSAAFHQWTVSALSLPSWNGPTSHGCALRAMPAQASGMWTPPHFASLRTPMSQPRLIVGQPSALSGNCGMTEDRHDHPSSAINMLHQPIETVAVTPSPKFKKHFIYHYTFEKHFIHTLRCDGQHHTIKPNPPGHRRQRPR